ncbi:hypothetical protein [Pseudoclavibacter sp. VKM Ac-2888]|uniref:hypothetical protein n=1 Tax=Pseudoclavibacter sp. VKM Ac-2888 TaxID=2783830 RepID=UPI00188A2B73|nr:hypothetical protein [Pseudoclavibacter sp. VKM Ac-2888]MBF4549327.1 hypothetical protein [Pseudoclavibacter sp. VKM Ac-2888]
MNDFREQVRQFAEKFVSEGDNASRMSVEPDGRVDEYGAWLKLRATHRGAEYTFERVVRSADAGPDSPSAESEAIFLISAFEEELAMLPPRPKDPTEGEASPNTVAL